MREYMTQAAYLAASFLFILGLRSLSSPESARRGMQQAGLGMLLAIVGTLVLHEIVRYEWIFAGLAIGSVIGALMAIYMPMTAMPQRIALSHSFGALAATLVGVGEYLLHSDSLGPGKMTALGFEVMFGSLTVTGSLMAFGKLQELVPTRPITYKLQNASNIAMFVVAVGCFMYLIFDPTQQTVFWVMATIGLMLGVLMVLPIGGADMPVVLSLLNSYAGLASAATGFAINNNVLIICGALDGTSGLLLSILMSKAMNRSFANVIFGAFGGTATAALTEKSSAGLTVRSVSIEDAAIQLAYARSVIVVPGYGMAVAQAQQQVRELADIIEKKGGDVRFAIHPVAGRMPGHMNVLLAEADVPYAKLYDMEGINDDFERADVALVVGANDVVNPAARNDAGSPIYGMPILNVDKARSVIVLKRSMNPGFAGIENELFYLPKTAMLFGDAKTSLSKLVQAAKEL
ncbi:MAG: NAD(P)(+) transhydrogenase (Re/Si-specific) subunit beta [Gemmatimonadaceae bacterium]